jgi:predicted dienelactone hydrolase
MKTWQRGRIFLLAMLISACGEEPERAPVQPLAASMAELSQLYGWKRGPWSVQVSTQLQIAHRLREQTLVFKVYYPDAAPGPLPLLLFSHGNWSSNENYDKLLHHWVSHGYVVVAPLHRDGNGGYLSGTVDLIRMGNLGLIQARVDDLKSLLDSLDEIEALVPVTLDRKLIAATGHSFGAFNAQQLGGAMAWDDAAGSFVAARDARILAVVALSPPGPMFDEINADSWKQQVAPPLMTTGTWDSNAMFWPDWRAHLLSWKTAPVGEQYALVIQGADHYLGNLICRPELEETPQEDALALINSAVITFLDANLKNEPQAVQQLRSTRLQDVTQGYAVLKTR